VGIKDLFITPIYLLLFTVIAYWIRPLVTTRETRKYFMPALLVRFGGAIALGLIYQFYYGGGDTFNYFTHGSRWIWEAFLDDPVLGLSMLFESGGDRVIETFSYSQNIWYYKDVNSFFVVRITSLFDLFTFHTYSSTALFFAIFAFSGSWAMFSAVAKLYQNIDFRLLAICILFVPTIIFWGSGILKDTITLASLGWLTWALIHVIELNRRHLIFWLLIILTAWLIYSIKLYILICFFPLVLIWFYWKRILIVKSVVLRLVVAPVLLVIIISLGYFSVIQITSEDKQYSFENLSEKAAMTAYDIRYGWGARMGGEGGYDIGLPDGTILGTLKLMPAAINVSFFRPYLWEVKNPLMLLAALESSALLIFTIWLLFVKRRLLIVFKDPFLLFCLLFAMLFAFAVGVSTFNFGTLMRYKLPLMPFFLIVLLKLGKKSRG
jgi:hypothetical protein